MEEAQVGECLASPLVHGRASTPALLFRVIPCCLHGPDALWAASVYSDIECLITVQQTLISHML